MADPDAHAALRCEYGKKRKRSCVALADNSDVANIENPGLIGNVLSERAIRRSALLSGIETTEGLASLPPQLSPEEVKLWETAYLVHANLLTDDLVTVLKVRLRQACHSGVANLKSAVLTSQFATSIAS